jgi:hypothetical protein
MSIITGRFGSDKWWSGLLLGKKKAKHIRVGVFLLLLSRIPGA